MDTHSIVGVNGDAWIDERSQQQYEILLFDEIFAFLSVVRTLFLRRVRRHMY